MFTNVLIGGIPYRVREPDHNKSEVWIVYEYPGRIGKLGVIRYETGFNGAGPWFWATWTYPGRYGRADTLEEAGEAFKRAMAEGLKPFYR